MTVLPMSAETGLTALLTSQRDSHLAKAKKNLLSIWWHHFTSQNIFNFRLMYVPEFFKFYDLKKKKFKLLV